jgi:hypothetical protein
VKREIQKRENNPLAGEGVPYVMALGVVGMMLYVVGLPAFVIIFLAAFSFFLWKIFATGTASDTRKIFEFYLAANEILRDDERRWYGFEVNDTISRGEKILSSMVTAPPLLQFAVGALYLKSGDPASAEKNLSHVVGENALSESAIVFPSNELREYVRVLRKIERDPMDAPKTTSAVRSLERLRKNKGQSLLEQARQRLTEEQGQAHDAVGGRERAQFLSFSEEAQDHTAQAHHVADRHETAGSNGETDENRKRRFDAEVEGSGEGKYPSRKPISELLQDIYDDKVQ